MPSRLALGVLLGLLAALLFPRENSDAVLKAVPGAVPAPPNGTRPADRPLPAGGTAALAHCGERRPLRPAPRGRGEQDVIPALVLAGYGYQGPGGKGRGRFTIGVALHPGTAPMDLAAPVAAGRVTVDVHGPHGTGLLAGARGLTPTVVSGPTGKPVPPPPSGAYRFAGDGDLLLEIELPAEAVCPGHDLRDLSASVPGSSNDTADYPVLVVTFTDPAVRTRRATLRGEPARTVSDRMVALSYAAEQGTAV